MLSFASYPCLAHEKIRYISLHCTRALYQLLAKLGASRILSANLPEPFLTRMVYNGGVDQQMLSGWEVAFMFKLEKFQGKKEENYELVIKQLEALLAGESNQVANLANAAALLNQFFEEVNWVGFYLNDGNELVLGPFQGLPACVRIPFGKGVCGTAAEKRETVRVSWLVKKEQAPSALFCFHGLAFIFGSSVLPALLSLAFSSSLLFAARRSSPSCKSPPESAHRTETRGFLPRYLLFFQIKTTRKATCSINKPVSK